MKETATTIKIYCSPFLTIPSDWEVLSLSKYTNLPFKLEWMKTADNAEVVMIPSHINQKSQEAFKKLLGAIPRSATLLIHPEAISRVTELVDVTKMQLEHALWPFPSGVLTPEEIIYQIKLKKAV